MTDLQLMFIDHYQQKQDDDFFDRLASLLGTNWDLSAINSTEKGPPRDPDKVFVPLSLVINPQLLDQIQNKDSNSSTVQGDNGTSEQKALPLDQMPEELMPAALRRPKRKTDVSDNSR